MASFYADKRKYLLHPRDKILFRTYRDEKADQYVDVANSVFGTSIRVPKRWTTLCQKLLKQHKAVSIELGNFDDPWHDELDFVNELSTCSNLVVNYSKPLNLAALNGNRNLEGLDLDFLGRGEPGRFDLNELPRLRRCMIPAHNHFASAFALPNLVSLYLKGGEFSGKLDLCNLKSLQELGCINIAKLTRIRLSLETRLLVLAVSNDRELEAIEPRAAITKALLDVKVEQSPQFNLQWIRCAKFVECIALRGCDLTSVTFLSGLEHLQVLDLFGSTVHDKDLSLLRTLPGELDSRYWSDR